MVSNKQSEVTLTKKHIDLIGKLLFDPEEQQLRVLAKKLASSEESNIIYRRSIVLDIHLSLEYFMNNALTIYAIDNADKRGIMAGIEEVRSVFQKFTYAQKMKLINAFKLAPQSSKLISSINKLRNDLVHKHKIKDIKYHGLSIVKHETIDRLLKDREKIKEELSNSLYGKYEKVT